MKFRVAFGTDRVALCHGMLTYCRNRDFSKAAKAATIYGSPCEDIIGHFLSVRMHVTVASFGFTDEVLFHSTFGTDRFAFCDGVQTNCRRVLLAMPSR